MKLYRSVRMQIVQILQSIPFWLGAAAIALLCLTTQFYPKNTETTLSIVETMLQIPPDILREESIYTAELAFEIGIQGGWIKLFAPILAGLPFTILLCDEASSGMKRMEMARSGKNTYSISRFMTGLISGGLVMLAGYLLFTIIAFCCLPMAEKTYNLTNYAENYGSFVKMLSFRFLGAFLYGAFWGEMSVAFLSLIRNKYIVLCVPFLFKYIWNQWTTDINNTIPTPEELLDVMKRNTWKISSLIPFLILLAGMLVIYQTGLIKRRDIGA